MCIQYDIRIYIYIYIIHIKYLTHKLHGAGICTNIYPINDPHVGKYCIHGASRQSKIYKHKVAVETS